jgi:YD repeat-containing protein
MTFYHGGPGYPQFLVFNEQFRYDKLNRLQTATDTGGWSRMFGYDRYGNMYVLAYTGIPLGGQTPPSEAFYDAANNRVAGATQYDAAGNQTQILNGTQVMQYDAKNRLTQVNDAPASGGGQMNFVYDGDGRRAQRQSSMDPQPLILLFRCSSKLV